MISPADFVIARSLVLVFEDDGDEAIQFFLDLWIASLAMTALSHS
jgi:hypothetical protein